MNAPFKAPATPSTEPPLWDLSDLYSSRQDARIAADLDKGRAAVAELNGLQGRLAAARSDPWRWAACWTRRSASMSRPRMHLGGLGAYAFLAASTAATTRGARASRPTVREKMTAIATPTVWLTLEINQLDDAEIEAALKADPGAARWRPWLRRVRAMKPHELSQELETFLAERGPISAQWPRCSTRPWRR
jgi:oligoendopeptidase F